MKLGDFHYELPPELIAQRPLERRDASRLLVLRRESGELEDRQVDQLAKLLRGDELLVFNNTRVIPARLFGKRTGVSGDSSSQGSQADGRRGSVEVLLTRRLDEATWEALVRPGRKVRIGEHITFGRGELEAEVVARGEHGARTLRFGTLESGTVAEHIEKLGHIPLPPYISRNDEPEDRERYQTIFAKREGAIAAPTAGLHFTQELLDGIQKRGSELCEVTLNVGLGTFQPIHSETIEQHAMHAEEYEIPEEAAERIQSARERKRPILAVGTTVVRALEAAALRGIEVKSRELVPAGRAEARLFIYPGFEFRVVDQLLTNFHLPESTLLALVSAFAGRERVLGAYRHAVKNGYRFYSYGDCMLIR